MQKNNQNITQNITHNVNDINDINKINNNENDQYTEDNKNNPRNLKKELKRVIEYYRENKNLFALITISFILGLIFKFNITQIILLKPRTKKNMKGGNILGKLFDPKEIQIFKK